MRGGISHDMPHAAPEHPEVLLDNAGPAFQEPKSGFNMRMLPAVCRAIAGVDHGASNVVG